MSCARQHILLAVCFLAQAWHRLQPNARLVDHYDRFLAPDKTQKSGDETSHRVLVPLCGKSVDMPYLGERGKRLRLSPLQLIRLSLQALTEIAHRLNAAASIRCGRKGPDFDFFYTWHVCV